MLKNLSILLVAALVCALPFLLRPARDAGEWREGDPVLVVVSPHIASIREEFARGFSKWHAERFGRPVQIDWRNIGGTTEIMRYLQGEYAAAFRAWSRREGVPAADAALAPRRPEESEAAAAWDAFRVPSQPRSSFPSAPSGPFSEKRTISESISGQVTFSRAWGVCETATGSELPSMYSVSASSERSRASV